MTVVHAVVGRKALAGLAVGLTGVLVGLAQFGDGLLTALPWVVAAGVFASAMFPVALTLATRIGGIPIPIMTSYFVACASLGGAAMAVPVGITLDRFGSHGVVLLFASAAALLVALIIAPTRLPRGDALPAACDTSCYETRRTAAPAPRCSEYMCDALGMVS